MKFLTSNTHDNFLKCPQMFPQTGHASFQSHRIYIQNTCVKHTLRKRGYMYLLYIRLLYSSMISSTLVSLGLPGLQASSYAD